MGPNTHFIQCSDTSSANLIVSTVTRAFRFSGSCINSLSKSATSFSPQLHFQVNNPVGLISIFLMPSILFTKSNRFCFRMFSIDLELAHLLKCAIVPLEHPVRGFHINDVILFLVLRHIIWGTIFEFRHL